MPDLTIMLPVYNEEDYLESSVSQIEKEIEGRDYEIVITEDGSTDNTPKIADRLVEEYGNITYISSDQNYGRGRALRRAFGVAEADKLMFMDADLATDLSHLKELIKESENHDMVVGSRRLDSSETLRPPLRNAVSKVYHWLINWVFDVGVKDVQCGFKLFSRELVNNVETKEDSWAWDTEIVVLAAEAGYSIKEIPVKWKEKRRGRTPILRLLRDIYVHGRLLLSLWFRVKLMGVVNQ